MGKEEEGGAASDGMGMVCEVGGVRHHVCGVVWCGQVGGVSAYEEGFEVSVECVRERRGWDGRGGARKGNHCLGQGQAPSLPISAPIPPHCSSSSSSCCPHSPATPRSPLSMPQPASPPTHTAPGRPSSPPQAAPSHTSPASVREGSRGGSWWCWRFVLPARTQRNTQTLCHAISPTPPPHCHVSRPPYSTSAPTLPPPPPPPCHLHHPRRPHLVPACNLELLLQLPHPRLGGGGVRVVQRLGQHVGGHSLGAHTRMHSHTHAHTWTHTRTLGHTLRHTVTREHTHMHAHEHISTRAHTRKHKHT